MNIIKNSDTTFSEEVLRNERCSYSNIIAFHTFTTLRLLEYAGGAWMKSFSDSYSLTIS